MTSAIIAMFQDVSDGNKTAPLGFLWFAIAVALVIAYGVWREWKRNHPWKK